VGIPDGIRRLSRSAPDELRISGETALSARFPGEPREEAFASAPSHSLRSSAVAEDLGDSLAELWDVSRLDQKSGDAVLDHLGKPAEAACDDRCPARHRLDARKAEKLRDADLTPVARHVHGGEGEHLRAAVDGGEVGVRDGA
jgi:hypothetical protein